jgi:hypothetical protein
VSWSSGIAHRGSKAHAAFGSEKVEMRHAEVDFYARTLARAAVISGGPAALATRLNVGTAQIEAWMSGSDDIPPAIFLDVVDVIMEHTLRALRRPAVG